MDTVQIFAGIDQAHHLAHEFNKLKFELLLVMSFVSFAPFMNYTTNVLSSFVTPPWAPLFFFEIFVATFFLLHYFLFPKIKKLS